MYDKRRGIRIETLGFIRNNNNEGKLCGSENGLNTHTLGPKQNDQQLADGIFKCISCKKKSYFS